MFRRNSNAFAKFQPYALALQLRFKWRHRMDENWRRLMDASCFCVDWQTRPRFNVISQFGGHWSHFVTCAHVVAPWDYPNFYPPAGPTRFVSKITAADCETQIRQPSMQGDIVYRTFASRFTTYIHRNPRLDLAVVHVEQAMRRAQEVKMLWMQNEGFHMRPRFEVLEELKEGDAVWIYGCTAKGTLFDEESKVDPQMVPTGVRGVVRLITEEHFFVDTSGDELAGDVEMGMCGAVVLRNGKCVGMLTATVAGTNEDKRVAHCAMCTHARDIRQFLLEVEQQMKNPPPPVDGKETVFQERRAEEGKAGPRHKDWEADEMRVARHVSVPVSLWKMEEDWTCEEDTINQTLWSSKNGIFGKEAQEEVFGLDMQTSRDDGRAPEGHELVTGDGTRPRRTSDRQEGSPANVYLKDKFATYEGSQEEPEAAQHVKEFYRGTMGAEQADSMDKFKRSVEAMHHARAREDLHQTAMNVESMREASEAEGWRSTTGSGTFPGSKGEAGPRPSTESDLARERAQKKASQRYAPAQGASPSENEFRMKMQAEADDLDSIWGKH